MQRLSKSISIIIFTELCKVIKEKDEVLETKATLLNSDFIRLQ